jgi:hypothetical protein
MPRRGRSRRASGRRTTRGSPQLWLGEDLGIVTADTVNNSTIYNSNLATSTLFLDTWFKLRSATVSVTPGNTNARVLFVIRRVPFGYTSPSITVTTGLSSIPGADVMGYALINSLTGATAPQEVKMTIVRSTMRVEPDDTIELQVVSNTSSTSQSAFAMISFSVSA